VSATNRLNRRDPVLEKGREGPQTGVSPLETSVSAKKQFETFGGNIAVSG
jgi:hypothetical protein